MRWSQERLQYLTIKFIIDRNDVSVVTMNTGKVALQVCGLTCEQKVGRRVMKSQFLPITNTSS